MTSYPVSEKAIAHKYLWMNEFSDRWCNTTPDEQWSGTKCQRNLAKITELDCDEILPRQRRQDTGPGIFAGRGGEWGEKPDVWSGHIVAEGGDPVIPSGRG